jgi:hypothetical protein
MNIFKLLLYCGIFILLFSNIASENSRMLILYGYLALMYYDCKNENMRSLIVILAFLEVVFYELDYILYLVSKDIWLTGPVAGDILLDVLILIHFRVLYYSICYRSEIMELFNEFFDREPFQYLPTKADFLQMTIIKYIMIVHMGFMVFNAYNVNLLNLSTTLSEYDRIFDELLTNALIYLEVADQLESLRHFAIVIVLSPWSKITKNITKNTLVIKS